MKRVKVAQYERALVYPRAQPRACAGPGMYWLWDPLARSTVQSTT